MNSPVIAPIEKRDDEFSSIFVLGYKPTMF